MFGRNRAGKDEVAPPAGDGSDHTGAGPFDRAQSLQMRAFNDMEQPPIGPVYVDPRHNLYMPSRYGMSWFGGLIPNQPLPEWGLIAQSHTARFHAPSTDRQVAEKSKRNGKGRNGFPTALVNPPQYLRHGGTVPIGIGPMQIQNFKMTTDSVHPNAGNGPGSTYANIVGMGSGFAAET